MKNLKLFIIVILSVNYIILAILIYPKKTNKYSPPVYYIETFEKNGRLYFKFINNNDTTEYYYEVLRLLNPDISFDNNCNLELNKWYDNPNGGKKRIKNLIRKN